MKGQWTGKYTGTNFGTLLVNIDEVEDHFEGFAFIQPSDTTLPSSVAHFDTISLDKNQKVKAYISPMSPRTGFQGKWDDVKKDYSNDVSHSSAAELTIELKGKRLKITAETDIGVELISELTTSSNSKESKISGKKMSWVEFKSYLSDFSTKKYLFRGQEKSWRLQTTFHRHGRYLIDRFTSQDVPKLHQRLSAITSHYFDLAVPAQNGAFFNLLQHHGYPTPLLDWSYSPYVAAFFAFRGVPINYSGDSEIRIFIFDNTLWQKKFPQIDNLNPPYPHLSVMEFIAIDNPRMVPQQALTTVTNIDDIESYLQTKQEEIESDLLIAIDIPAKDREEAMRDLRFMGITAGSMFPSIDGVCEELKEINFEQ
jgi:hypothetical protein